MAMKTLALALMLMCLLHPAPAIAAAWEEVSLGDMDLIQASTPKTYSFSEETRWYEALSYSNHLLLLAEGKPVAISYDDLAEIQSRIVGGDSSSLSGLRDPGLKPAVIAFLEQLNSDLVSVSEITSLERRIVESSKVAAWSMLTLKELRPFADGNGRVMEVINNVIMQATGVAAFPFRVHTYFQDIAGFPYTPISRMMMMKEAEVEPAVSSQEMTDYVILKLWLAWRTVHTASVFQLPVVTAPSSFHRVVYALKELVYTF